MSGGPVSLRAIPVAVAVVAASLLSLPTAAPAATGPASKAQLASAKQSVDDSGVRGIAWYVDSSTHHVVVTADSTVTDSELARVKKSAGSNADTLRIVRTTGTFRPLLAAGDAIYGGGYRCSLGFNVQKAGVYYFLTAGHCGKVAATWFTSSNQSTLIGGTQGYSFPGNDYALVRYDNTSLAHPGGYTVANAFVG